MSKHRLYYNLTHLCKPAGVHGVVTKIYIHREERKEQRNRMPLGCLNPDAEVKIFKKSLIRPVQRNY